MTSDAGAPGGGLRFAVPGSLLAHARRFRAEGRPPVPPRVAATVLLLRPAPGTGFEGYLLRRAASMTFGGVYAFPGGGVDRTDSGSDLDWAGPDRRWWADRLGLSPEAAQAVVCAAAREVFEEAGVLLAGPEPGTVVGDVSGDDWEAARAALVARELGFAELLRGRRLALRSDLLLPWSRWLTPEFEPRRFDTYFFVALLPAGQRPRDVSGEADHTMWIPPAEALARAEAGELAMLPPTAVTLTEVAACADLAGLPAVSADREVTTPVTPRLEEAPDGSFRFVVG
ncbi:NUDIX hydrolase [Solwaraspora sp. WMMD1047]|uniref:NUDIX hydrolase n=1 Tax=Solwaraspora sp. WMMD1047 TaxID=3016102 RepID=UPI002417A24D|nr:NUDIX hydrolase [Solwaraspora sp. WMMD1047]MDG4833681.1 NUDIX hydrolase [Solwaraspora sp. WMMD1047]